MAGGGHHWPLWNSEVLIVKDLAVSLADRPGTGARVAQVLADAGMNIEGVCYFPHRGQTWGLVHVLLEDGEKGRDVIEGAGFEVREVRDVILVDGLMDRPGVLAALLEDFADHGVNIDLLYMASKSRLVIGTEQMHEAREGVRTIEATFG
jgi:hypothetical protein